MARSRDQRKEVPGVGFNHVEEAVVDAGLVAASFVVVVASFVVVVALPRTGAKEAWKT